MHGQGVGAGGGGLLGTQVCGSAIVGVANGSHMEEFLGAMWMAGLEMQEDNLVTTVANARGKQEECCQGQKVVGDA